MRSFGVSTILLDIEGTTAPLAYVQEVLFPYARRELAAFLERHFEEPELARVWELLAKDAGGESVAALAEQMHLAPKEALRRTAERLMDADAKATGLKELQGRIWKTGFEQGELKAEVFEDVPRALERWTAAGIGVRIYSSGSIAAQKLYFGHTAFGDLTGYLSGYYDTTTGPKREAESYRKIANDVGAAPETMRFLSDVVAELDAAQGAGMKTGLLLRPGNAAVDGDHGHCLYMSFDEIA